MRSIREIINPAWQDIWDRDEENRTLTARLAEAEASREILNEIDAVLYFGFMICESVDGRAEVRIKFADLRHAQRLHSALVAIRNGTSLEKTS